MKKIIITMLFITLLRGQVCFGGPGFLDSRWTIDDARLIAAIERVESAGRVHAVGDGGRAVGCLQIHKKMVDDVNRILKFKAYSYIDRANRQKSFQMAQVYLNRYGRGMTFEQKARIWNGGPRGHKKAATVRYAEKVKRNLPQRTQRTQR